MTAETDREIERYQEARADRRRLARKIFVLLAVKVAALAIIFVLFFAPMHRPHVDTETIERSLIGTEKEPGQP